jgi:hypothetical protein
MPMSPRRKQALARELRDLVFRACSAGGALLGLVYALHHWSTRPRDCNGGSDALAGCASHTLAAGIVAFLVPVFVGAVVGAAVASRIRVRARSHGRWQARGSSGHAVAAAGDDQGGEGGHWLLARYAGRCDSCRQPIAPGDRIRHSPGSNVCEGCGGEQLG